MNQRLRGRVLAAALAIVGVATVTAVITITVPGPTPGHDRTITVTLGGAKEAPTPTPDKLRVPAAAVDAVARTEAGGHEDSRDETPAGVPPAVIEKGREQQDALAANDQLPVVAPDAAPWQPGCRSRFISSYSSRRGVAPRIIVLHYTVSPNVTGWSDVDGVTGFFGRTSTQASSNYVIDGEGHCNYIVREVDKAWAQATFNPLAVSIEVVNSGRETVYIRAAGLQTLARVVHDTADRWKIPLQPATVSGCTVTRPGVGTHQMLGACGGGHVDISPYGDQARDQVIAAARAIGATGITPTDRRTCAKLTAFRRDRTRGVRVSARRGHINATRRQALEHRGITCTNGGPVRR